jgi:ubiquinone/menaquinone biosynthesis C-methylase UbiE
MSVPQVDPDISFTGEFAYADNPRGMDVNLRSGPQMREYEAIADRIAADRPGSVLDWGCGWGQVSVMLREGGLQVSSIDYRTGIDEGLVPLERYPEHEVYLTSEPVALPYPDDHFDAVLSLGVLEHVHDPVASLAELHRVVRPGGRLYVYKLPNRFSYLEWVARRSGDMYFHGKNEHDTIYTARSARRIVEDAGFTVGELRRTNMLPLTVPGALATRLTPAIWAANRGLARVPGLSVLATNVELVATARR